MKNHHLIKQTVKHQKKNKHYLSWWQLSLIGIGSIIGAGFFLGTGLSVQIAGPAIILDYLIAGITAFFVFIALADMTIHDPEPGSFRTYARKAFGHSVGFVSGWMYWISGILIMSSEIVALSTFTKFWFPATPLWIFSILYSVIGFGINLLGVSNFGKIESLFAVVKLSTLIIFIVFGALLIFGFISPSNFSTKGIQELQDFIPNGLSGMWSALIFVFFSFGGIAVVGVASTELKSRKDVPKAGIAMLITLVSVYTLALFFILSIVSWTKIDESESPFVTALSYFQIPYLDSIFNLIIISAAFSTMVGALFSITSVMVALANDHDAPKSLADKNSRGVATKSLLLSAAGLSISIIFSFLLPNTVYEYVTTSAGVMLILNWLIILASQLKLHPSYKIVNGSLMYGFPFTSIFSGFMILLAVTGALLHQNQRIGVFISFGLVAAIFLTYKLFISKKIK